MGSINQQYGEWTLESSLGKGGNATVFKAQNANGEVGALKLFYKSSKKFWKDTKQKYWPWRFWTGWVGFFRC